MGKAKSIKDNCIIVTTLSDNKDVIVSISNELIKNHLVAGCQISQVESIYWWNNEINNAIEYKLEVRTIVSLYYKIETLIKQLHNYELPEISYQEIQGSEEIISWINENVYQG